MTWIKINLRSGILKSFENLSRVDRSRLLLNKPLPFNILDLDQLEQVLSNTILPEIRKEVLLIEGYYPPKFGIWPTHKTYRITYQIREKEEHMVAKIMDKKKGNKELSVLLDLCQSSNTPKPFCFLYDEEIEYEFLDADGILLMNYIKNIGHFENCLVSYCIGEEREYKLKELSELLFSIWSAGVKHNDLKGHHLLFTGREWFAIDFEKSERFKSMKDIIDELSILIGDSTLFFDRFMAFNCIKFENTIKERYKLFLDEFLQLFDVDSLNSRCLPTYIGIIQNKELRTTIEAQMPQY